jgi:membrane protein implicated in regulation of membrane protease activity
MLVFYIVAGIVGAVFIVATIVMGGDVDADVDADVAVDADVDVDVDADVDTHLEAGADHGDVHVDAGVWLPFLSFRFWTYFACFFGATGTVLTLLGHGFIVTIIFSALVGLLTGWMASYVMRRLATEQISSDVTSSDYVGLSGKVIVPVGGGKQGQVRVFVKGSYVDLMAESDTPEPIAAQSEVLVFEMRGPVAKVVPGPVKEEAERALPEPSKAGDSEGKS